MKRIVLRTMSVIAFCLVIAQAIDAEKKAKSGNDEQILRQLMQEWAEALVKADQAAIDRIVRRDWMLVDSEGNLISKGQADANRQSGAMKFESFKFDQITIQVHGDTAVVHALAMRKSSY